MKKILDFFGLTLKKDYTSLVNLNTELKNTISKKDEILSSFESFDYFKPEMSYDDYVQLKTGKNQSSFDSTLFYEHFNLYHRKQYSAFLIKKLVHKDHNMLNAFLMEFSSFDWESVRKYMEEVDWKWHDNKTNTPSIERLKYCVINLINFKFTPNYAVESGGFKLTLCYKEDGEPFCKIEFDKNPY